MDNIKTTDGRETNGVDEILEYAIRYSRDGSYTPNLTKDITRGKAKVKVLVSHDEQRRVLKACHSKPTSGHFGVTKELQNVSIGRA